MQGGGKRIAGARGRFRALAVVTALLASTLTVALGPGSVATAVGDAVISGTVTLPTGAAPELLSEVSVRVYPDGSSTPLEPETAIDSVTGAFAVAGLDRAVYRVEFAVSVSAASVIRGSFYGGDGTLLGSEPIDLSRADRTDLQGVLTLVDGAVTPEPGDPTVTPEPNPDQGTSDPDSEPADSVEDHTSYDPDAWDRTPDDPQAGSEPGAWAAGPEFEFDLPYQKGHSWGANGPHADDGGYGVRNSIDYAGGDGRVRAPADGTVRFAPCSGVLIIEHTGEWRTSYYHTVNRQVVPGQKIKRGDWIADIGNDASCGGSSTGAHVHMAIWKYSGSDWANRRPVSLQGMRMGGWTVRESSDSYFGTWTRNSDGWRYATNGYASCGCITNYGGERPFSATAKPKIDGTAMVGSTLTAVTTGWKPAPSVWTYRWKRNGANIAGATKSTYVVTAADVGAKISLDATGDRDGYKKQKLTSASTVPVILIDSNGNSIPDAQELLPWNSDVNGDGRPDVVGFTSAGVKVSLMQATGTTGKTAIWTKSFASGSTWSTDRTPRTLVDVNGDGRSDVVGFAASGVYVALSTGSGFGASQRWIADFGTNAGWNGDRHPRGLADMNGDGLPDVVGFGEDGVYVALNTGTRFSPAKRWSTGYAYTSGWRIDTHPRYLADMNGDGRADIVGFANQGVSVSLSTGSGLSGGQTWTTAFASDSWRVTGHPRTLADVNGDGLPDIVGFASKEVRIALNTGSGFGRSIKSVAEFGHGVGQGGNGWRVDRHPRILADVNGDGRADIIGFGDTSTLVSLSTGAGFAPPKQWAARFGYNQGQWRVDTDPRMLTDVNGDGKADIVAFGSSGAVTALSTGNAFAPSQQLAAGFASRSDGWQVYRHPRAANVQSFTRSPSPGVTGIVVEGRTITAVPGSWIPTPTRVSYQWLRDGASIPGATGASYKLSGGDVGRKITVRAVGTRFGLARTVTSSASQTPLGAIRAKTPTVSGGRQVGSTLTGVSGSWKTGSYNSGKVKLKYQWKRNGVAIAGATMASYRLRPADAGMRISLTVTGSRGGYSTSSRDSSATSKIRPGALTPVRPVVKGSPKVGKLLQVDAGKWRPGVVQLSYQWKRNGVAIPGATQTKYRLTAADRNHSITVSVRGVKSGYTGRTATSKPVVVR